MNRAAFSPSSLWSMAKESFSSWSDDFAPSMGAAISYYTIFSIAPLLVIAIAIAGFVFGREAASGALYGQISGLLGDEGARSVQTMVEHANSETGKGIFATVVSVIVLLLGATGVFAELQNDLDRIWRSPAVKKQEGVWAMIRGRLLSLGMVMSIGFLLLVSLAVSAALAALGSWWGGVFGEFEWLMHLVNFVVSFAVITLLFALMFKILPRVSLAWQDVWIGAMVTALLFTVGKFLVGLYLGKSSVASGFGAAGSLAVMLVWVYYSAQIFLLGAEFTGVYAHRYGSKKGEVRPRAMKQAMATTEEPEGAAAGARTGGGSTPGAHGADASPARGGTQQGAGARVGATGAPASLAAATAMHYPADAMPAGAASVVARAMRTPAANQPRRGVMGTLRAHPGLVAGGALLLGAVAGEVLNRLQSRRASHSAQARLADQLAELRLAAAPLAPLAVQAVRERAEWTRDEVAPRALRAVRKQAVRVRKQAPVVMDAMREQAQRVREAARPRPRALRALRREAGRLRDAIAPSLAQGRLARELSRARKAMPAMHPGGVRAARRETAKAAHAAADTGQRLWHWLVEHRPWRRRSALQRAAERMMHAAHRA